MPITSVLQTTSSEVSTTTAMVTTSTVHLQDFATALEAVRCTEESDSDFLCTSDEEFDDTSSVRREDIGVQTSASLCLKFTESEVATRKCETFVPVDHRRTEADIKGNPATLNAERSVTRDHQHTDRAQLGSNVCIEDRSTDCELTKHSNANRLLGLHDKKAIHECGICKRHFRNKNRLLKHMSTHSDIKPFSCEVCGQCFKQERGLKSHKHYCHTTAVEIFRCSLCDKRFKREKCFRVHIKTHKGIRFNCDKCEKSYSAHSSLKMHMKIHERKDTTDSSTKPLSCEICQKNFMLKVNLELHMKVHFGTQEFVCVTCDTPFSRKVDLERHVYTHTGELPYKCTDCPRAFSQPGDLGRHKSWHRGDNTCQFCGKRYSRKDDLRRHVLKHEQGLDNQSGTSLQCHICQKVFACQTNLNNHTENCLAKKKSYECQMCGLTFKYNSNFHRHMREKHVGLESKRQQSLDSSTDGLFCCDLCSKRCKSKRALTEHVNYVHIKKRKR